jgi:regulator of RNase E activity RraB
MAKEPDAGLDGIAPPWEREGYEKLGEYSEASEGDRKILAELVARGSDLSKPRHTIHYFYFDSEEDARAAGRNLREIGFDVSVGVELRPEYAAKPWPVLADRTEVINEGVIAALRGPLTSIAKRRGGDYDGWEAQVDSKADE